MATLRTKKLHENTPLSLKTRATLLSKRVGKVQAFKRLSYGLHSTNPKVRKNAEHYVKLLEEQEKSSR